jgi:hypothetical protein
MSTLEESKSKLDELSAQISTLVRTLALGVLAVAWLFLSGDSDSPPVLKAVSSRQLVFIALLSVSATALDLLQYVVAYRQVKLARRAAIANAALEVRYKSSIYKSARVVCFWGKLLAAGLAAAWLVVLVFFAVL